MRLLLSSAIEFVDFATEILYKTGGLNDYRWRHLFYSGKSIYSLDFLREKILNLEEVARSHIGEKIYETSKSESVDSRFPVYSEVLEVIPIYREAVSLQCQHQVVKPLEIPGLLHLLKIPGHQEGLDVENHGFGYHFHYGRIKSEQLHRTNLLLTFDPAIKSATKQKRIDSHKPSLFYEYHADGKCKSIDAESIGQNKRLPIYLICRDAASKRGFENFKRPSKESIVFHG